MESAEDQCLPSNGEQHEAGEAAPDGQQKHQHQQQQHQQVSTSRHTGRNPIRAIHNFDGSGSPITGAAETIPGISGDSAAANSAIGVGSIPSQGGGSNGSTSGGRKGGSPVPIMRKNSPRSSPRTSPLPHRGSSPHGRSSSPVSLFMATFVRFFFS